MHASLASEIGQRIVRGDYPPGTILPNEQQWSQTFDVSRSAVREAIKMLMAKSLLVFAPQGRQLGRAARTLEPARSRRARLVCDVA